MTLDNMRHLGVHRRQRGGCAECGARGLHIDVRPNWKEQPLQMSLTGKVWR
jgi:hypothetical protein